AARARAFGWHAIEIDGHNLDQISAAYKEAEAQTDTPTLIIARTIKGKGFSEIEDRNGWHGKALPPDAAERAIRELGGERNIVVDVRKPKGEQAPQRPPAQPVRLPRYEKGSAVATRSAYGDALKALGAARPAVVAVDGEVSNSTYAETFAHAFPNRSFNQNIEEEQWVATPVGLGVAANQRFAPHFAPFFTRPDDFIRMAAISRANIKLCGSHAGVSIGQDGPSQMALEDLAMMRAVHGSLVLYPCDSNQTAHLLAAMADYKGISYLRSTREKTPVIYSPDESFPVGGSKVVRQSAGDQVTVVAAGITLHEALKAADQLQGEGTAIRVIDAYSVKPIDAKTLHEAAQATGGRLVVVEDHWVEGGLGDAVLAAFAGTEQSVARNPLPRVIKLGV